MKIKDILGEADVTLKPMPGAQEVDIDGKPVGTATPPQAATAISDLAKKGEFTPAGDDQQTSEEVSDDTNPRTKMIHALAHKMGWGVSDLELLKDHELVALYHKHGDIDEESGVYPSRNPGTPAAAQAAQSNTPAKPVQSVIPSRNNPGLDKLQNVDPSMWGIDPSAKPVQSVMPSRNANSFEGHKDTIAQSGGDVGGDATDNFINQIRDKKWEKANRAPASGTGTRSPLSEKDELYKWLTIAGIK
jgi:hypothetical protein